MADKVAPESKVEIEAFMASMARLYRSEMYSDLRIECRGRVFKVHRAVVCSQSKPLAAMVNGDWKEAADGKIDLEEDDPSMVAKMIDFLYRTRYNDDRGIDEVDLKDMMIDQPPLVTSGSVDAETQLSNASIATSLPLDVIRGPLVTNAKVYILGDKYDIPSLRNLAARKYKDIVKDRWNNDTFAESAKIVYENIVRDEDELKNIIVEAARANMSQLLDRGEFVNLFKSSSDMAFDVLTAVLNKTPGSCQNCSDFQYAVCNYCHNKL